MQMEFYRFSQKDLCYKRLVHNIKHRPNEDLHPIYEVSVCIVYL